MIKVENWTYAKLNETNRIAEQLKNKIKLSMTFLNSILNKSKEDMTIPFKHWELNKPLSDEAMQEIIKADIPNVVEHNLTYDGTRAIDGGSTRI